MSEPTRTVLVIDDEQAIRSSFVDFFQDKGWETIEADSGEAALEILETRTPDCAIVDIRLKKMDGTTFIKKALKNKLVFVICTGSTEFTIPKELLKNSKVSTKLFKKPIIDLNSLENELINCLEREKNE